ncbi:MAG TPA: phosphotransferase [Luteibacter sp.]|uniref:phosphotransferase enzyme family protein n=1 Tax=Luteibacter sp. TaxID=1886636 RepID=UPI002CE1A251|nr:phosphotransferase [Luteibacter sp.]HVI54494.1 phosphotransferase [Luteibacter sp.]
MTDDAHLAHGLAGDELPPDWPPLTLAEVSALLRRFPSLGAVEALSWHSPRPLSAAALVQTSAGAAFVKRHHRSVRSPATLAEEHRLGAHLRDRAIPLPRVLLDVDGASAIALDEWVYEVHEPARGTDVYRDAFSWSPIGGVAHARAAGAMLARLHMAAFDYAAPQRTTHILVARADILSSRDPLDAIATSLSSRQALGVYLGERDWRADIGEAIMPWHARAFEGIARQPRLWTHGDWHVSNLCWSDASDHARITDVLDLGLSAATFALFDLATAIERNAIAWLDIAQGDIGRTDLALALIDGYRGIRPLAGADLVLLADLLPIVHLDFALSEVEYFEGVTRRRDHADVAYHTFLRGHAAWFTGRHGQALLDAIRHAAGQFVVQ